jgi:hypothetical protein
MLFDKTEQTQWKKKDGNYAVDHDYNGIKVRLVWGLGGIVSCFVVEPRGGHATASSQTSYPQTGYGQPGYQTSYPQTGYGQPGYQTSYPQTGYGAAQSPSTMDDPSQVQEGSSVLRKGYTWTRSGGQLWWRDTFGNWRARVEGQTDWWYA